MTPTQLLQNFDRLSEAPDAIPRLRRFILDLAVRGKLVEQDPNDELASELLKRIQKEKAALIRNGKLKESKSLPIKISGTDKILYEIPANWKWIPLGESVNNHLGGGTPSKNNSTYWDGDTYWASVKDVGKGKYIDNTIDRITEAGLADSSSNLIPPGNLIVVTRMGLGKISINRVPIAINQDLRALSLSSLAVIDYYYIFFKTHGFEGTGLTVKGIKVEELMNIAFPLPPLAEQHRIVAKVDELMTLCDQLEAAKAEREQSRDRLLAANLHHLNQPTDDEEAFREYVRFTFNHLPRITTRPAHIKQLRQTILNLAVRGKLVPQDPNDEPAAKLFKRIQDEKVRLIQEGFIKKTKALAPIHTNELPCPLPDSWIWARTETLCEIIVDCPHSTPVFEDSGIICLDTNGFKAEGLIPHKIRYVSEVTYRERVLRLVPRAGDIVFAREGSVGASVIIPEGMKCCLGQRVMLFRPMKDVTSTFFSLSLSEPSSLERLLSLHKGIGAKHVNVADMRNAIIPFPPLNEQHRIVAKVNELMALCDQLETQLNTTEADSRRLLEAVLHEALMPVLDKVA